MSADQNRLLIEQIRTAGENQRRLTIQGHASKSSWLPAASSDIVLALGEHSGVLQYEPEELRSLPGRHLLIRNQCGFGGAPQQLSVNLPAGWG